MTADAATRWWWIRHAPVIGHGNLLHGQQDVDCDTTDAPAFAALAALLPPVPVWIATPLKRTQQTLAAITAAGSPSSAEIVPRLEADFSEQHFGEWQGLSWQAMQAADAFAYSQFWSDPTGNAPPGGESFAELIGRVRAAIERLTQAHAGADIVAVAHGGSIRAAAAIALDLTPAMAMAISVDCLSLTRLRYFDAPLLSGKGSRWRIDCVNAPCRWIS